MTEAIGRVAIIIGGMFGAAGVALSAWASHGADARLLGTAAAIMLAHAPALLALAALTPRLRLAFLPIGLLGLGVLLFSGDLVTRHLTGSHLFPMAAPTGGLMLIFGWLATVIGAVLPPRRD